MKPNTGSSKTLAERTREWKDKHGTMRSGGAEVEVKGMGGGRGLGEGGGGREKGDG